MTLFTKTTDQITVSVEPSFEPNRSQPEKFTFVFKYRVTVSNNSKESVQINRRSWIITDAYFNKEYVEGEGVVGEQPIIMPDQSYTYESFCPLKTSFGTMKGHYYGITESGKTITIDIPEFILAHPFSVH